jgi:cell wall-associated protease
MNKIIIRLSLSVFALGITNVIYAQEDETSKKAEPKVENVEKDILNWYNGTGTGMQTEKAYGMLKKRTTKTVIVAIVDSGMDIEHVDLQGKIWTNPNEIAGNGIDDDKNGYIDDIHGWNFLGNANGDNANDIRLEVTRIYAELNNKYGMSSVTISSEEEQAEYALYLEVKEEVESTRAQASSILGQIKMAMAGAEGDRKKQLESYIEHFETQLNVHYNPDHDGRAVIGDNPNDFTDTSYGNNDVEGPDAFHGTHVGGIVGAVRGNGIGGDGVANDVQLMSVRAVPNGDEYDKDIALAIRYAVDNGASVINMSFGKAYSPHAEEVYAAFKYADSKGVLLVHAAGNDAKDIDEEPNYPTSMYDFQEAKLDHFLTIGASTRFGSEVPNIDVEKKAKGNPAKLAKLEDKNQFAGNDLAAAFSNYGITGVDVFAPGFEIYNSVPQSDYAAIAGTSMACPMVAGCAAFLKSYFPNMSMKEIKDVLLETATVYTGQSVVKPGGVSRDPNKESATMDFGNLSVTGGVINLAAATKACLAKEK